MYLVHSKSHYKKSQRDTAYIRNTEKFVKVTNFIITDIRSFLTIQIS